jgi:hypothetical protein
MEVEINCFLLGIYYSKSNLRVVNEQHPVQAWKDPEGSRRLRLPDFKTIGI